MAEEVQGRAKASERFEAAIRKRSRPVLSADERKAIARQKMLEQTQMAAARCREAADAQIERAKAWDAEAAKLGG